MNYSLLLPMALIVLFAFSWKSVPRQLVPFGFVGLAAAELAFIQIFVGYRAALLPLDIGLFSVGALCILVALIGTLRQPRSPNGLP